MHLLCAPFPSPQGTQACVAAMLRAELDGGSEPRLLAYAEGYGSSELERFVERLPALPFTVGSRSGPSLARIAHDLGAVVAMRARRASAPVFAHNVEAGVVCALSGVPYVYVAHTSMHEELPTYGRFGSAARPLGDRLDRAAASRAAAIAAIVPDLRDSLAHRLGRTVDYLPVPWEPAKEHADRDEERARLGIGDAIVVLHAGNLDRYQGLDTLIDVMSELGRTRRAMLLVATESDPAEFTRRLAERGVRHRFLPLATERDRQVAHAVADVALVTRSIPGGLPIKLLEALARGVPVVTTRIASGGLPLGDAARVLSEPTSAALAAACVDSASRDRAEVLARGHAYLAAHHGAPAFRFAERTIGECAAGRRPR